MKNEINSELLTKYLANKCNADEERIVLDWLALSEENRKTYALLEKVWKSEPVDVVYQNPEEAWNRFTEKTGLFSTTKKSKESKWQINRMVLRYAAAILIILLPFLYFSDIFNTTEQQSALKEFVVQKGNRQSIILSDGTKITLDAGSSLKYPAEFKDDIREIFLEGEAFFEVTPDSEKPFIVKAEQAVIKVLGTKFNVRSWKETGKIILAVSEGKVGFKNRNNREGEVILYAGELSTISGENNPQTPHKEDINRYLAWMKNEIYFDNVSLSEVISQLERWYDVTVVLKKESAKTDLLTINIRNKSYKENFDFLAQVAGLKVSYNGKVITLY